MSLAFYQKVIVWTDLIIINTMLKFVTFSANIIITSRNTKNFVINVFEYLKENVQGWTLSHPPQIKKF